MGQGYIYIARKSSSSATCPFPNNPLTPQPLHPLTSLTRKTSCFDHWRVEEMSCPREPKDGTALFTLHLAAVDKSPPHCLPPALQAFHSLRPRHPFPFLLPGEARGAGAGCTLTCLDTTVCFCSVARARRSTFATLEMQVKSQRRGTGDVFKWERKEKVIGVTSVPFLFSFFFWEGWLKLKSTSLFIILF